MLKLLSKGTNYAWIKLFIDLLEASLMSGRDIHKEYVGCIAEEHCLALDRENEGKLKVTIFYRILILKKQINFDL